MQKFRVYNKHTKASIHPCVIDEDGDIYEIVQEYHYEKLQLWNKDDIVVQQFTGLQDKDGVDIYEGDIVSCTFVDTCFHEEEKEILEVKIYPSTTLDNISHSGWESPDCYYKDIEIIGNILYNPELLSTGEK